MQRALFFTPILALYACSSSSTDHTTTPSSTDAGSAVTADASAPAYPSSPYGTDVGETIADLSFQGWNGGTYDAATAKTVRLADFYDPSGAAGRKLLVLNVCSVWCLPCKDAFASFKTKAESEAQKGVALVSILYENGETKPISLAEAADYGKTAGVSIPLLIDPGYQLSTAVRADEIPAWVVVSARDMKILGTLKSTADAWTFVEEKLTEIK